MDLYKQLQNNKIIRADGRLNSAIIRRDGFNISSDFKFILEATSFLDPKSSLGERLFCIKQGISELCRCKCGSTLKWEPSKTAYAETCGSPACYTRTMKRGLSAIENGKAASTAGVEIFNNFVETYSEKRFVLHALPNILEFIAGHLNSIIRHGISRACHFKNDPALLCSIIEETATMIPVILTIEKLRLNERCYLLANNLASIPVCDKCGMEKIYKNFKTGYYCNNKICYQETARTKKHENKQLIISNILEKNGFRLVSDRPLNERQAILHCLECDQDFDYWLRNGKTDRVICPKCHRNNEEESLFNFIKSIYDGQIIRRYKMEWTKNRTACQELDIYLPELKIAFEYDGIYWHSDRDRKYHLCKTESCLTQDIKLYHIFSNEWLDPIKQSIWKSIIASALGESKRIFARKCEIRKVDRPARFLIENHLQGACASSIAYGLFYQNELVCLAAFGKARYSKKYDFELLRFCNALNTNAIGGFSRLLSHFRKHHEGSIVTYADRRLSCGDVYEKNGFSFSHASQPNYFYWKGSEWHGRERFQKHRLKDLLEKFDANLSERENMRANGWHQIYDCGNLVYFMGADQ